MVSELCRRCSKAAIPGKGYCADHLRSKLASYRPQKPRKKANRKLLSAEKLKYLAFYNTEAWGKLRDRFIRANPWCQSCLLRNLSVPATEVDHVLPRKLRPDLELEESNLQALCKSCHSKKTNMEKRGFVADFRGELDKNA